MVDLLNGAKVLDFKWIFNKKADNTFKGRLLTKGFRQIHGINYHKTFSPVVMLKSKRILLAKVAYHDYEIWQMDVKTAFLNENLLDFADPLNPNKVYKLQRSIYWLKHASRSWNLHFHETVTVWPQITLRPIFNLIK